MCASRSLPPLLFQQALLFLRNACGINKCALPSPESHRVAFVKTLSCNIATARCFHFNLSEHIFSSHTNLFFLLDCDHCLGTFSLWLLKSQGEALPRTAPFSLLFICHLSSHLNTFTFIWFFRRLFLIHTMHFGNIHPAAPFGFGDGFSLPSSDWS